MPLKLNYSFSDSNKNDTNRRRKEEPHIQQQINSTRSKEDGNRLNCRRTCHSFTCHWIRIRASIVLSLVLESLTSHVNEVDQSGRVFCSYSRQSILSKVVKILVLNNLTCYFSMNAIFKNFCKTTKEWR